MTVDEQEEPSRKESEEEENAVEDAVSVLLGTLKKRQKDLDDREKDLKRSIVAFEKEKEKFGASTDDESIKQNDVLYLNIGGTVVNVSRKTLTQVEGSMLASLFSGRWDDSIEKDRDGNYFINQPPELFLPLIDFFREKLCETPSSPAVVSLQMSDFADSNGRQYLAFLRMVEYYGLTPGMFPCSIELHSGLKESCEISDFPELCVKAHDWSVFTLLPKGHDRKVCGYEVKLGDVENFQVGWLYPPNWTANTSASATTKVGEHSWSLSLDLCASGFLYGGTRTAVPNLAVSKGDVIRCVNVDGNVAWYVNGTDVPDQPDVLPPNLQTGNYIKGVVPAFSGKGQCWITKVDLDY